MNYSISNIIHSEDRMFRSSFFNNLCLLKIDVTDPDRELCNLNLCDKVVHNDVFYPNK
jgi:hypothetical protein